MWLVSQAFLGKFSYRYWLCATIYSRVTEVSCGNFHPNVQLFGLIGNYILEADHENSCAGRGGEQMDTIATNEPLFAFSILRASRLTGLSASRLRHWDNIGLYSPEFADEDRGHLYSRVYSFRDIVGLRTLARLRERVPLKELRRLGVWLKQRYDSPWASLRFYLLGKQIIIDDPKLGYKLSLPSGQLPLPAFPLEEVAQETLRDVNKLRDRSSENIGKVIRHRHVMSNTPIIAGTRIPTSAIWEYHDAGYNAEQILREYPQLRLQDIEAAISEELRHRRVG